MRDFTEPATLSRKIPNPFIDEVFVQEDRNIPGAREGHQRVMSQWVRFLKA